MASKASARASLAWGRICYFCGSTGEDFAPVCPIKISRAIFLVCLSSGQVEQAVVCARRGRLESP